MRNDLNWIIAGVAAAILLPLLTIAGVPFIISVVVAAAAFAGLVIFLTPRKLFEGLDVDAVGKDKVAFARELLTSATPAAERLAAAADRMTDSGPRSQVRHLRAIALDVFTKVETNPGNASAMRRFLSYYLPRAAEIAEGYAVLAEKHAPDPVKLAEVGGVIDKLEDAFVHYADSLADKELGALDIDLKLIQASLKEDIGR